MILISMKSAFVLSDCLLLLGFAAISEFGSIRLYFIQGTKYRHVREHPRLENV